MHKYTWYATCALAPLLMACGPVGTGGPPAGTTGELGAGVFSYRCVEQADAMCDLSSGAKELNNDVALGARFGMTFEAFSGGSSARVVPASDELLSGSINGDSFTAEKTGHAGLVASRAGTAIDVMHLFISEVDSLRVERSGAAVSSLELAVGETATLRAVPMSDSSGELAGALVATWNVGAEALISVESPNDNSSTIEALAEGTTVLTITLGEHEQTVEMVVTDALGQGGGGGAGGWGQGGAGGQGGSN